LPPPEVDRLRRQQPHAVELAAAREAAVESRDRAGRADRAGSRDLGTVVEPAVPDAGVAVPERRIPADRPLEAPGLAGGGRLGADAAKPRDAVLLLRRAAD